ncbi:MAG TPA: hypothetical protein VG186_08710 [Solirubrobacteraceae bacterium]|jgi:hypothetical protein|nr:hypothetical protein [Solirubrobacteraceae bacterium]
MTGAERQLRADLAVLAASDHGRRLLQLGLRGIARGERGVSAGCWTRHGSAGCLFQHAYWEGVRDGVFADRGRPGDWIGSFVGPHDYGIVIRVIDAFDRLARSAYADIEPRAVLPDRIRLRQGEWNRAVERLLVEVLGESDAEAVTETDPVAAGV